MAKDPKRQGNGCTWTCYCGEKRKKTGSGYTNLFDHVKNQHKNYVSVLNSAKEAGWNEKTMNTGHDILRQISPQSTNQTTIHSFVPKKANNIYGWLNWVITSGQPFSFVEEPTTRMYTNLQRISRKTFVKYMNLTVIQVEKKISSMLPNKFSLIFDAWTSRTYHFLGLFAAYEKEKILLSFTLLDKDENEDYMTFDAEKFRSTTEGVLEFYNKTFDNVVCITGDNCSVNKAFADLIQKPMVGCASHRLNLAVNNFLEPYESELDLVEKLMIRLRTLKNAAELRQKTSYSAVIRNKTRWSSTFYMVKRYRELYPFLDQLNPELADVLLSPREHRIIEQLFPKLENMQIVTKKLQKAGLMMAESRLLLDALIDLYPDMASKIGPEASIVKCPDFENAIVKIQQKKENELTELEQYSVIEFLKDEDDDSVVELSEDDEKKEPADFGNRLDRLMKKQRRESDNVLAYKSKYIDTSFVYPVGDDVERLFSAAGNLYDSSRGQLELSNLESQLFLKINRSLWNAETVWKSYSNDESDSENENDEVQEV